MVVENDLKIAGEYSKIATDLDDFSNPLVKEISSTKVRNQPWKLQ